jgi:hypothetical protein
VLLAVLLAVAACHSKQLAASSTATPRATASVPVSASIPSKDPSQCSSDDTGMQPHQLQCHSGALSSYLLAPPPGAVVDPVQPGDDGLGMIRQDSLGGTDTQGKSDNSGFEDEAIESFVTRGGDVRIDLSRFNIPNDAGGAIAVEAAMVPVGAVGTLPQTALPFSYTIRDPNASGYQIDAFACDGDVVIEVMITSTDPGNGSVGVAANRFLTQQFTKLVGAGAAIS